jgi:hypothetical protein
MSAREISAIHMKPLSLTKQFGRGKKGPVEEHLFFKGAAE